MASTVPSLLQLLLWLPGSIGRGLRRLLYSRVGQAAAAVLASLVCVHMRCARAGGADIDISSSVSLLFGMLRLQGSMTISLGPAQIGRAAERRGCGRGGGGGGAGGEAPLPPNELRIRCPEGLKDHIAAFLERQAAREAGAAGPGPAWQLSPGRGALGHDRLDAAGTPAQPAAAPSPGPGPGLTVFGGAADMAALLDCLAVGGEGAEGAAGSARGGRGKQEGHDPATPPATTPPAGAAAPPVLAPHPLMPRLAPPPPAAAAAGAPAAAAAAGPDQPPAAAAAPAAAGGAAPDLPLDYATASALAAFAAIASHAPARPLPIPVPAPRISPSASPSSPHSLTSNAAQLQLHAVPIRIADAARSPPPSQSQTHTPHASPSPRAMSHFHNPTFLATLGSAAAAADSTLDTTSYMALMAHAATYKPSVAAVAHGSLTHGSASPPAGGRSSMGAGGNSALGGGSPSPASGLRKSPESILGLRMLGLEGWRQTTRQWEAGCEE